MFIESYIYTGYRLASVLLKVFLGFNMCKHQLCKVLLALDTDHCFFSSYWMFLNCPSLLSTAGDQNYFTFKVFYFKMHQTCGLLVGDCASNDLQSFGAHFGSHLNTFSYKTIIYMTFYNWHNS